MMNVHFWQLKFGSSPLQLFRGLKHHKQVGVADPWIMPQIQMYNDVHT